MDRTASAEELEEMFRIFENRREFESVYHQFEKEWESRDVRFETNHLTLDKIREDYENRKNKDKPVRGRMSGNRKYRWIGGIAAGMVILVSASIWYFTRCNDSIYETGYGETKEIVLNDQSTVQLNANSRLVWKDGWRETGIREIYLQGEAFFEVNKINGDSIGISETEAEHIPFRVVTPDLTVNVYGTAFNVVSRREKTDVFLESGSVELELKVNRPEDIQTTPVMEETQALKTILMKPGDAVSYSVYNQFLEHVNNSTTEENASWIAGSLSFENESLKDVLNSLEDIYGKKFQVSDTALLNRKVDLGLPYEDWETVSGVMTLSLEVNMKDENGKINLERKKGN